MAADPGSAREGQGGSALAAQIENLRKRHARALSGGGPALCARHHERGKVLVRDRVDLLLDPETPFLELSPLAADGLYDNEVPYAGIVTGIGLIHDTPCIHLGGPPIVKAAINEPDQTRDVGPPVILWTAWGSVGRPRSRAQ